MAGGRPPKERSFYNALSVALAQANGVDQEGKRVTRLRTIAEKLVEAAEAGESWAIKEVADRIDGKPAQAVEFSGHVETRSGMTDAELEAIASQQSKQDGPTIN